MMNYTCTKKFGPFPFAHRQPNHDGHCRLLHGHSWYFEVEFQCSALDGKNYFVQDFGKLKEVKSELNCQFDHTTVINNDDPDIGVFLGLQQKGLLKLTRVNGASAEGIAHHVFNLVNKMVNVFSGGRVSVKRVTVFEEENNSATYQP